MITRAKDAFIRGQFLQEFIPIPQELRDTTSGFFGDIDKQHKLVRQRHDNIEKYGYKDWYDFAVGEWGTKWDVGGDADGINEVTDNMLVVHFESAWSPPVDAYRKLEAQGFSVEAHYNEYGMCFCGTYNDGNDSYFEYAKCKVDDIRELIGSELDDMFAISEGLDQQAQENEEEESEE
jgi:hypothetical protein